jgi:hypothetical protein
MCACRLASADSPNLPKVAFDLMVLINIHGIIVKSTTPPTSFYLGCDVHGYCVTLSDCGFRGELPSIEAATSSTGIWGSGRAESDHRIESLDL